ncbi:MAG: DmsE family decaheme c-type cytochrome [Bryobacteraceae bacterium]
MRLIVILFFLTISQCLAATYVGGEVCKTCHSDIADTFNKNPHFRFVPAYGDKDGRAGCESCHGPGSDHVKKPSKATIAAFSVMRPEQVLESCLSCHGKQLNRSNIHGSEHTLAGVACSSCHSIHGKNSPETYRKTAGFRASRSLLKDKQVDLCYSCHPDIRAQFSLPFKHRVNEGSVSCTDCHNPHGTPGATWRMGTRPRMVRQTGSGEETCLQCHTDKRGPFVFEHAAVRVDGCETCHSPHGSTNARLLRRPVVFTLCLECHNGAGTFGRNNDGVNRQTSSHDLSSPRYHNCTACHVRVHGSNTDPRFLR